MFPETLTIKITQEDIDKGVPGSFTFCPIANAVSRNNPDYDVRVAYDYVLLKSKRDPDVKVLYHLPREGSDFVDNFDCEEPVEPISFVAKVWENPGFLPVSNLGAK
jgi:hypothetical protein